MARAVALRRMDKGRVPAPAVDARHAHPALEQVERSLRPHATAGGDIIRLAVFGSSAGVDDHDLERLQLMADALELRLDIGRGGDIAIREMAEVEFHAGLG